LETTHTKHTQNTHTKHTHTNTHTVGPSSLTRIPGTEIQKTRGRKQNKKQTRGRGKEGETRTKWQNKIKKTHGKRKRRRKDRRKDKTK
jgi:hypothetical protein